MRRAVRWRRLVAALLIACLAGAAACTSDDDSGDGRTAFRNLGKRGDSDVGASRTRH